MTSEEERQSSKEQAVLLALQHNQALIRRNLEIYAMNKSGSTEFISKSKNYDNLWRDALIILQKNYS